MTQPYAFCNYLRGILDASKNDMGLGVEKTTAVKAKLHSVFKHVIDPSYPQHLQASMQQAHDGKDTPSDAAKVPKSTPRHDQARPSGSNGLEIMC